MQQLIQTHPKRGMDLYYGIAYARDETIEGKVQAICLIDDYLGLLNCRVGLGALGAERIP